jgi:hypothetical protein
MGNILSLAFPGRSRKPAQHHHGSGGADELRRDETGRIGRPDARERIRE